MKKLLLPVLLACLLVGCRQQPPPVRIVQRITVSTSHARNTPLRVYTDGSKLKRILDYLRTLPRHTASAGDAALGDGVTYLITLHNSDGTVTRYRQKAWRYLYSQRAGWQQIPPRQAQRLKLLLAAMEGD